MLISQLMEARIVGPDVHGKFELADKARASHKGGNSPLYAVVGGTLWQRRTVSSSTPNHLPPVHVRRRVAWVHAPNVRSERTAITMRVHGSVIEVIVPAGISPQAGVILVRREHQRSAASPTSHQFRGDPFLLFRCLPVLSEEITKRTHMLFHPEISHIAAVFGKSLRLRHSRSRSLFIAIAKEKFTCFDRGA